MTDQATTVTRPWRLGYSPALDGVRALAIAGVLLVHLHEDTFTTGGYGVDVFFALSGFLITLLLLQEDRDTGRIHFAAFYGRRALRLLPALYTALLVVTVYALVFRSGTSRTELLEQAGLAAVYLRNWPMLLHLENAAVGPIVHLWSLSLEEQFYLLWPPILSFFLARRRAGLALALTALAVVLLADLRLFAIEDPTTLSGQRADALFLGCATAMVLYRFRTTTPTGAPRWVAPVTWVSAVGLGACLLLPLPWRGDASFQRIGITLVAVAAAALVTGVVLLPDHPVARVLGMRGPVAVGRISYGLYIWHLIIFKLWPPKLTPSSTLAADVMLVALAFAAAIASFVLIERPALRLKARLYPAAGGDRSLPGTQEPDR